MTWVLEKSRGPSDALRSHCAQAFLHSPTLELPTVVINLEDTLEFPGDLKKSPHAQNDLQTK